jgi:hypothetical protein
MAKSQKVDLEATKRLMGALVRMPPKQHDEMKLGRPKVRKRQKDSGKPVEGRPNKGR